MQARNSHRRSRNDQVALDMKLYEEMRLRDRRTGKETSRSTSEDHGRECPHIHARLHTPPESAAGHTGSPRRCILEMFVRDRSRLADIRKRMNTCSGCRCTGRNHLPLDREYTAQLLGFDGPTRNSMDSVSDRDYVIELLSAFSTIMMHMSRFCEEIIMWNSNEYRFVEIDDAYSTGSSIMPQKRTRISQNL